MHGSSDVGGCGARAHRQDSGANPVGGGRSKRRRCAIGDQKVYALLPDAKTWDFAGQERSRSYILNSEESSNAFLRFDVETRLLSPRANAPHFLSYRYFRIR